MNSTSKLKTVTHILYHIAKPKRQMFFLQALGKCATRKAMRAGRFLDKSAFLLGHGARTIPSSSLDWSKNHSSISLFWFTKWYDYCSAMAARCNYHIGAFYNRHHEIVRRNYTRWGFKRVTWAKWKCRARFILDDERQHSRLANFQSLPQFFGIILAVVPI